MKYDLLHDYKCDGKCIFEMKYDHFVNTLRYCVNKEIISYMNQMYLTNMLFL